MGDSPIEAGEPPDVETFGVLELRLSSGNSTGYCDVYPLKDRKKKPFQAKIYRPWRKDFITLGTFASAHEAAVAVAQQRDWRALRSLQYAVPPCLLPSMPLIAHLLLFVSRAEREAKACCGDGHRHSDAYYNSNIRKQACAAASREPAAVVRGREHSYLWCRQRWRCAACGHACASAGSKPARSWPSGRRRAVHGSLSRLPRKLPAFARDSDARAARSRHQTTCS